MSATENAPETDAILERLRRIDRSNRPTDRKRAEEALARHFVACGAMPFPVRWARDVEAGYLEAGKAESCGAWHISSAPARNPTRQAPVWISTGHDAHGLPESPIPRAVRRAGWSPAERQAHGVAAHRAWWEMVRSGSEEPMPPTLNAPRSAGLSAAMLAAPGTPRELWLPFLDALEAGLWVFWVLEDEILAVARPTMRTLRGRLHSEEGPAVYWPSGAQYWFWQGTEVPRSVVERPRSITPLRILNEENMEVRRVMLERYGAARFLEAMNARPTHADDFGTLYRVDLDDDEPLVMVKVVNSTPEPDGTRRDYFLRVPPEMRTARDAVAWTFGLREGEYLPAVQT